MNRPLPEFGAVSSDTRTRQSPADSGHPTTALSLVHLVTVLMYRVMRWDPKQPAAPGSDRLVLSEGHAVPIIYAACADLGVTITPGGRARPIDSSIDGHPNPVLGFPFFDAATGSLGQGLSVSGGLAAAARIDRIDKTIYCADHTLTNVVAIFNCNTLGQSDFVATVEDWQHLQHKAEAGRRSRSTGTIRTPSRIRCAGARSSVPANLCASSRAR